jgi:molecular chaperone GrpE
VTDRNEEAVNGEDAAQKETDQQPAPGAGPDETSPGSAQEGDELAAVQEELARYREAMLRMQAETENLRKRLARDLERSRKMALEGVMKDLLAVRDSLERGLEIDPESATVDALLEGQELTLKMLGKVMADHQLEVIDPKGERFDPEWHEAMTVLPSPDHEENTVLEVIQKGYRLHDRLIRPARVVVSRKS